MRIFYRSTTRPKHIARRLHTVFPALSLSGSQNWTGRLLGYRDWHELHEFTKHYTGPETPDVKFGIEDTNAHQALAALALRIKYQQSVLAELAGADLVAPKILFDTIDPNERGFSFKKLARQLGYKCTEKAIARHGSAFYQGLAHDLYPRDTDTGEGATLSQSIYMANSTVHVHSGLPVGENEERFYARLMRELQASTNLPDWRYIIDASDALRAGNFGRSSLFLSRGDQGREEGDPTSVFAEQRRPMRFFLVEKGNPRGFVAMSTTAETLSDEGPMTFHVEVHEAWSVYRPEDVYGILAETIKKNVEVALARLLWLRVRNPEKEIHVQVTTDSKSLLAWSLTERLHKVLPEALEQPGDDALDSVTFSFNITQWGNASPQDRRRHEIRADSIRGASRAWLAASGRGG